jgi:hypothetical protein
LCREILGQVVWHKSEGSLRSRGGVVSARGG